MPFEHNCNHSTCDHEPVGDDGTEWNLNSRIDLENLQCLNEEVDGSCKKLFRSWDERLSREHVSINSVKKTAVTSQRIIVFFLVVGRL